MVGGLEMNYASVVCLSISNLAILAMVLIQYKKGKELRADVIKLRN